MREIINKLLKLNRRVCKLEKEIGNTPSNGVTQAELDAVEDNLQGQIDNLPIIPSNGVTYRLSADTPVLSETGRAAFTFGSYQTLNDVGNLATFNGTNLVITSGANRRIKVTMFAFTEGIMDYQGDIYFRDITNPINVKELKSSQGVYGQNSSNEPCEIIIDVNTTVTLNIVHTQSQYSQILKQGSFIQVKEI
jgi:hypothetical protein